MGKATTLSTSSESEKNGSRLRAFFSGRDNPGGSGSRRAVWRVGGILMRSVFTLSAVLVAAFLATACVEGVDEVNGVDDAELEEVEVDMPAETAPDVVRSPQSFNRSDDPDEGGQIKPISRNAAKR